MVSGPAALSVMKRLLSFSKPQDVLFFIKKHKSGVTYTHFKPLFIQVIMSGYLILG